MAVAAAFSLYWLWELGWTPSPRSPVPRPPQPRSPPALATTPAAAALALAASVLTALASAAIAALATAMTYVYALLGCMYMRDAVRSCVLYWTALLLLCSGLVVEHFVSPAEAKLVSVRVSSARRRTTLGTLVTRWAVRYCIKLGTVYMCEPQTRRRFTAFIHIPYRMNDSFSRC